MNIYYHRTDNPNIEFKDDRDGIYFTNNNSYGKRAFRNDTYIVKATLNYNKPFTANKKNVVQFFMVNAGYDRHTSESLAEQYFMSDSYLREYLHGYMQDEGYDAIIIPNDWDGAFGTIKSVIVFKASQINIISIDNESQQQASLKQSLLSYYADHKGGEQ